MGESVHSNVREVGKPYDMHFGDLLERVHFGSFSVVVTSRGVLFETYTGYHVWTTPFVKGYDGVMRDKSLYRWLMDLLDFRRRALGHEDDPVDGIEPDEDGHVVTNGEMLEMLKVVTECNLMSPVVVFGDGGRPFDAAVDYMRWLKGRYDDLLSSVRGGVLSGDADDMRALADIDGNRAMMDALSALGGELSKAVDDGAS